MENYVFDEEKSSGEEDPEALDTPEEAFLQGYSKEEEVEECAECGGTVPQEKRVLREIDEEEYIFCSEKCAVEFEESLSE